MAAVDNRNSPVASQHNVQQCRPSAASTVQGGAGEKWNIHLVPKKGDSKLMAVILLIISRFSDFFTVKFSSKFAAQYLLNITQHLMCVATLPCETLMSKSKRQSQTNAVINDKLQGTVVAYFKFGGIFND